MHNKLCSILCIFQHIVYKSPRIPCKELRYAFHILQHKLHMLWYISSENPQLWSFLWNKREYN